MKHLILLFLSLTFAFSAYAQNAQMVGSNIHCSGSLSSQTCINMQVACINDTFSIPANTPSAPVGNNYDCLGTQPNPTWFYMSISNSGSIDLDLVGISDLDFILWGPFSSPLSARNACGTFGNGGSTGGIVDCSFSTAQIEQISIPNAVAGEVYVLLITNFSNTPQNAVLTQTAGSGTISCSAGSGNALITGNVYEDANGNCNQDGSEQGLSGRLLMLQPGGFLATTDANGFYGFCVQPDSYTVELLIDTFLWSPTCPNPTTRSVVVTTPSDSIINQDFGIEVNNSCSDLWVDVATPILRPCFQTNKIYVYYCNDHESTTSTDSVTVTVTLDTSITPLSSTFPWTSVTGNEYNFYLGTLNPGDCGSFVITAEVNCSTTIGATLCTEATISPLDSCSFARSQDSTTTTNTTVSPCTTAWDKSSLNVEGSCDGDTIRFVITNTGDPINGDMSCFSPIRIYIDTSLYILDSLMIGGGDSLVLTFPANGQTWRLEADQHPLHPGNSHPNAVVELCGDSASIAQNWNPGIINQFPLDDANPNVDIDCAETVASFDPNDKRGFPLGISDMHTIQPNTDLEYMIRFQNTGTDTAFNVTIQDVLPPELNIMSVVSGASSHDYTFSISGDRVLEWKFSNIMLPDSNTNEPASHGFISFHVEQAPNLPLGTYINNDASIYFDFNAAIITNLSQHLIANPSGVAIITGTEPAPVSKMEDKWNLKVYPNPAEHQVTIQSDLDLQQIHLLSINGQTIQEVTTTSNTVSLPLDNLPLGVYILDIRSEAGRVVKRIIKMK
ncbi:MAG: T9SS type A sorting domain-containing protein [Aureispira sp.]|nr:T9SS type A sorting domain-containing protein [Aureispira sp.]